MPPKKRARGRPRTNPVAATAINYGNASSTRSSEKLRRSAEESEKIYFAVPPKKRKMIHEADVGAADPMSVMAETKPVPEWLKVSIQLLLLNFHHEGVSSLSFSARS
jgi:hypothetical protein